MKSKEWIKFQPRPHQEKAIKECIQWFVEGEEERGQLILPCGAGKTLTALWIKEKLASKNTLVLVPSLALLRQIKSEWAKQKSETYDYICICSEKDIDKKETDTVIIHTYEVGGNVTTNPLKIREFLNRESSSKIIFSTYQSLPAIEEAIKNNEDKFEFDFTFCDEAHKTAGVSKGLFSIIHDNIRIPSKKRLYATATPRIVKESVKKKLEDNLKYVFDMNDPKKFGEEFFRMSFKEAIEQGILVDYKIIAIGVNDKELASYIEQRKYVNSKSSIDEFANNYALEYVMSKYNANHALTFHSRVKLADQFSTRHSRMFPSVNSYSVNGTQATSIRKQTLDEFKKSSKAIIANSRCLTEGVDVPTIDLVYFSDPKNSKVDIVQAVGRALRKKAGKEIGYIVVPVYHTNDEKLEIAIKESSFKNLIQVIRSLCDHDERLQDEINQIAFGKGKRNSNKINIISSSNDEYTSSINLIGFEEKIKTALFSQVIIKTSNNWDLWFLKLKEFLEENDDYPTKNTNVELYRWIALQRNRRKKGALGHDEFRKLNGIGFIWDKQEWKWNKNYSELEKYALTNDFPPSKTDFPDLNTWYKTQQNHIKKGTLREDRKKKIELIKFIGNTKGNRWLKKYEALLEFRKENPDRWPSYDRKDKKSVESQLYVFCQSIRKRYREDSLSNYWFDKMTEINFNFEGKEDNWTNYYNKAKKLLEENQTVRKDIIGNAYEWLRRNKIKLDNDELSKKQAEKIQALNLDLYFKPWEDTFLEVKDWVNQNDKFPTRATNKELHSWLLSQKTRYKNDNLSEEEIIKLQSIDFELESTLRQKNDTKWLNMFKLLCDFRETNSNEWPKFKSTGVEKKLYNWCQSNRQAQAGTHSRGKRKPLKQWKVDKLDSIGFYWSLKDKNEENWEENYQDLVNFLDENELEMLSTTNRLGRWLYNQYVSYRESNYDNERFEKFLNLGIDISKEWTKTSPGYIRWCIQTKKIVNFKHRNGHFPKYNKSNTEEVLYPAKNSLEYY